MIAGKWERKKVTNRATEICCIPTCLFETVHGSGAGRKDARHSGAGSDWQRGCSTNAGFWNEGEL